MSSARKILVNTLNIIVEFNTNMHTNSDIISFFDKERFINCPSFFFVRFQLILFFNKMKELLLFKKWNKVSIEKQRRINTKNYHEFVLRKLAVFSCSNSVHFMDKHNVFSSKCFSELTEWSNKKPIPWIHFICFVNCVIFPYTSEIATNVICVTHMIYWVWWGNNNNILFIRRWFWAFFSRIFFLI